MCILAHIDSPSPRQQSGPNRIVFADGTEIEYELPALLLHGILWGQRTLEYSGSFTFRDLTNKFYSEVKFDPDRPSLLSRLNFFSSKKRPPCDMIRGDVLLFPPLSLSLSFRFVAC